jgi:SAM-dependent methyltransferase
MTDILKKIKWWHFWTDFFTYEKAVKNKTVLEIGSGKSKIPGTITIDINSEVKPNIVHDLNQFPWPINDNEYDTILMFSIIEHLAEPIKVFEECHRILKPSGRIYLITPHFSDSASYVDPTHKWHFSARSFDYFIKGSQLEESYGFYTNIRFTLIKRFISLRGIYNKIPGLQWLVNNNFELWEDYFCYILRGQGIYIELEKE